MENEIRALITKSLWNALRQSCTKKVCRMITKMYLCCLSYPLGEDALVERGDIFFCAGTQYLCRSSKFGFLSSYWCRCKSRYFWFVCAVSGFESQLLCFLAAVGSSLSRLYYYEVFLVVGFVCHSTIGHILICVEEVCRI